MDRKITQAVENYVHAGYPTDAEAVLLAEVDGPDEGIDIDADRIREIGLENNATEVRLATDETERALLWKGRKTAFGAIAQIAPDYYLHDTVVPRSKLADVLEQTYEIAERHGILLMNVLHAGDGNLHPLLIFDGRDDGVLERVLAAGEEIITASLAAGGVLSGEHGIGVEKQRFMHLLFSDDDLDHQNRLRRAFDPACRANPGKVMPTGHSCADIQQLRSVPTGVWG
jgi:glycolate oxidase